jgi:ribosomal protein S7
MKKLINLILKKGKKGKAYRILYSTLATLKTRPDSSWHQILESSLLNRQFSNPSFSSNNDQKLTSLTKQSLKTKIKHKE